MDNHCSPLLLPADLIEANYTGPSVCDCWYAFHPEAVKLGQMDPVNPTYAAGDCPDLDVEACFAREDMTYGPFTVPTVQAKRSETRASNAETSGEGIFW